MPRPTLWIGIDVGADEVSLCATDERGAVVYQSGCVTKAKAIHEILKRDKRRIKSIYGTLISFHGRDRFSFQIFENGKGHLLDFPNDTTRICPEMFDRLKKLMGEESWRVEAITFQ